MAGTILSQSVVRDPFAEARKKLEDKKGTVLSSSTDVAPPVMESPTDISPLLQKAGVDGSGIANNELGRISLFQDCERNLAITFIKIQML